VNNSKKYDFLSILNEDEKRYEDHQEHKVTHLQTLMSLTSHFFLFLILLILLLLLLVEAQVVALYQDK